MSKIGRRQMVPPLSLTIEACEQAVADAGLTFDDIDGLSTYPGLDMAGMGEGGVSALEGALGLRPTWINGGMDTFGPGGSVIAAMMAVATGMARHVLCFRTLWEATFQRADRRRARCPLRWAPGTASWSASRSARPRPHTCWRRTRSRHFHRYGTTRETLGWIALNQRANAALQPDGDLPRPDDDGRLPVGADDHHAVRALRLRRAVRRRRRGHRVGRRRRARPAPSRPSWSRPSARRSSSGSTGTRPRSPTSRRCSARRAHLWSRTSLRPSDVDVAELYDGFTLQLPVVARGARLLRHRRGQGLPRRRQEHRARRRASR